MLMIYKFLSDYFNIPKKEDYLKLSKKGKSIGEKYKILELNK